MPRLDDDARRRASPPAATLDCTASIVTYRSDHATLRRCAESFLREPVRSCLAIVDNGPAEDRSHAAFEGLPVLHVPSPGNVGFGRGHNLALTALPDSRYHLVLNPDVVIHDGAVQRMVAFMDANPDVGMACPRILNPDGTVQHLQRRFPTVVDLMLRRFLPSVLRPLVRRRLSWYVMEDHDYANVFDVPCITGPFLFCRTELLRQIGGFDPRYFLYFEDSDLSRTVRATGARLVCNPHVSIEHVWARAPHKSLRMALVMMRNGLRYFDKWGWELA
jgi:GT2 family glycosyltransferase